MNINLKKLVLQGFVASALLSCSQLASAGDLAFVTVGATMSVKVCCGPGHPVGFGPALNHSQWMTRGPNPGIAVGGFGYVTYYPSLRAARLGVGPQASATIVGAELGPWLWVSPESVSLRPSAMPFGSVGLLWTGVRMHFGATEKEPQAEVVLGAGYPLLVDYPHGRLL